MRVPGAMESPKPRAVYWNHEGAWTKMLMSSGEEGGKCTAMVVLVSGTKRIDVAWMSGRSWRRRASWASHVGGVILEVVVVVSFAEALGERKKGLAIWKACRARWCFILFARDLDAERVSLGGEEVGAYIVVVGGGDWSGVGGSACAVLGTLECRADGAHHGGCEWLEGEIKRVHGKESWTLVRRQKYIYELGGLSMFKTIGGCHLNSLNGGHGGCVGMIP